MKSSCERCGTDLKKETTQARICSYE
ncbi:MULTISPECIES: DUF1272 domain-containing protein [Paraburkholderia]